MILATTIAMLSTQPALRSEAGPVPVAQVGQLTVTLSASPSSPRPGEPVTILLQVSSVGGPMSAMLKNRYEIAAANAETGQTLSTTAMPVNAGSGGPSTYGAALTLPSPGTWAVSSPNWSNAPGNLLAVVVQAAQTTNGCQFQLGFAALHDLLPEVVGPCLEGEQHNSDNGDGLQRTAGGLLVWRKADNWTAFTDGNATWINGPIGLQQRLNRQRFWWEANPDRLPIVPSPQASDRCHTAGLSLALMGTDAGAGNVVGTFRFTNTAGVLCTLAGYVGAQLLDASGNPLPTQVVRGGGAMANEPAPTSMTLPALGTASFKMHWGQVPVGNETTCPTTTGLAVTPPDEYTAVTVDVMITACGGGRLDVSPVEPAP